jgi:hypothetical protein
MSENPLTAPNANPESVDEQRRGFLIGLGRWSQIAIGAAVLGGLAAVTPEAQAGAWVNRRGYGGAAWVDHRAGGGAWVNHRGGGGAWVNRR